jgi:hypothetical protein
VKAVDVMASVKIGACIVLYPIFAIMFTVFVYIFFKSYLHWSTTHSFEYSAIFLLFFPIISFSNIQSINDYIVSIRSSDGIVTHYKTLQARTITFFNPESLTSLKL